MIDQTFGETARFLTATGLRLDDARAAIHHIYPDGELAIGEANRAFFLHCIKGELQLVRTDFQDTSLPIDTSIGLERGSDARLINRSSKFEAIAIVSSIGKRHAFIQQLPDGVMIIRPEDRPFACIIKASVATLVLALNQSDPDFGVVRRICEIIMLQLLRFVQQKNSTLGSAPQTIQHDPHLLRFWTAFFAKPSANWTIKKLANAAGLSRSAFIARFNTAFGEPPKTALTRLRMEQARHLLQKPNLQIFEIAVDVGYASEAAFIRAFKREFGITPGLWRKKGEIKLK